VAGELSVQAVAHPALAREWHNLPAVIYVTVTDHESAPVKGLGKERFHVRGGPLIGGVSPEDPAPWMEQYLNDLDVEDASEPLAGHYLLDVRPRPLIGNAVSGYVSWPVAGTTVFLSVEVHAFPTLPAANLGPIAIGKAARAAPAAAPAVAPAEGPGGAKLSGFTGRSMSSFTVPSTALPNPLPSRYQWPLKD